MKVNYYNGVVYSGDGSIQQAFAVEEGRFIKVGTNSQILGINADTTVDLNGKFVCAGFNDSHMHVLNYGHTLTIAPLWKYTNSLQEMIQCLKETTPSIGGWILGRGWNQDFFTDEKRMPDRWDMDKVSEEYPVCATRACGHALAVNSKALKLLGITSETQQPEGGQIVMDNGQPNGVFYDNAMELVTSRLPVPDKERIKTMICKSCQALNARGITSCHSDDYSAFQGLSSETVNEAYRELEQAGELTVRVYEQSNFNSIDSLKEFIQAGNITGTGTDKFKIGPLKLLGDGALGARTAFLSKSYKDDPGNRGLSVFTQEEFDRLICYANRKGMQVAVHCIGDACLDLVLSSLTKALEEYPRKDHRHGIVHCQITREDQLHKIAQSYLHVYAQTIFLDYDLHIVRQRVGDPLAQTSYNWNTLKKMGVTVSNGSDCPVEMPDVLAGIQCAVTRCDLQGNGPYLPNEAFTLEEALDSFTSAGAWASFEESSKGKIKPGMYADFVILSKNPFETDPFQKGFY